ncbi:sigma-70 family RNA polymerase sigma factor [Herbaspirillum sp. WKF16]|uniref:sigma-70 family RNA polymerase sigma factor n=1 Tax=Herbaspirillum sp. WKF16 TaxID=3028312 RepID=UPI0023A9B6AC|nr:sigma-70 family RNA polymerase sigma factor [Herbaspirillum sp. WKF16]WDZ97241.1 sigma-70 family RNA polymerase sigma factor [Herbaspirillum sp. WKF16]
MSNPSYPITPPVETLYRDHHGWLQGWLRLRLGDTGDAADLAQEAFLRLIVKPASRGFANFAETRAYLRTMAQGMCINLWRRREIEQAWLDTLAAQSADLAPSAEHQAIVLEALLEISSILLELPSKAAAAFLLSAVCDMTAQEVADEIGVSTRMVRKYVSQAMLCCLRSHAAQTTIELAARASA